MRHSALSPAVQEAIDWLVRLDSGEAGATERQAFDRWLASNTEHRQAWESLNRAMSPAFEPLLSAVQSPSTARAATQVLRAGAISPERRRLLRGGSALLLLAGLSGLLTLQRRMPLEGLFTDSFSGTGERKRMALADGSVLTLNARTTVDVDYSVDLRRVHLHQGELCLEVKYDAQRPFEVRTAQGLISCLGGRFIVAQQAHRTLVSVEQQSVQVLTLHGASVRLDSGHALRFDSETLYPLDGQHRRLNAWLEGLLDVNNVALGEVIDALRPYRDGVLRISEAAAKLRVFGVFPLDDSERSLQSLAQVLPITLSRYGPITLIDIV
ncbi:MAG: FecR domain-containing protein [Pseudomonas sp.]